MTSTYATLAEYKERIGETGSASNTPLQQMLDSAAELIDANTRGSIQGTEAFSATSSTARTYDDWLDSRDTPIDDLIGAPSAVTRGGVTVSSTYYQLWPYNRGNGPYTIIQFRPDAPMPANNTWYKNGVGRAQLSITGTWGYCTQANRPAAIKEATLLQAVRMWEWQNIGDDKLTQMITNPYKDLDPQVRQLIKRYTRDARLIIA